MKWYEFSQNNSGGSFDVDDKLCHRLFIEAETEKDAVKKAEEMGAYFDGIDDCPCCGNRWHEPDELKFPEELGAVVLNDVESYAQNLADNYGWTKPDARIFYASGDVKEVFKNEKRND